jgi:hypothetical protein
METDFHYVGRVRAVYRYPVKSMRAESLLEAQVGWYGIDGDRRYAFVRADSPGGFPWLTGREVPEMVRYVSRYSDPAHVKESPVVVINPAGQELPLESPELLEELSRAWRGPLHLIHLNTGCHDAMPLSLVSTASVEALGQEVGLELDPRRFRPNLLVEPAGGVPFGEDEWIGSTIQIGEGAAAARVRIDRQNQRCAMINIDPETAQRDPRVLKTLVRTRDECMAVYGSTEQPGLIRSGDPIYQWTI